MLTLEQIGGTVTIVVVAMMIVLIAMLASGVSGYTLKIGTINLNKLTAEEKALATNKGWSIIA